MLAALGRKPGDDTETARAYVGALLFVDAVHELRQIRKLLTSE